MVVYILGPARNLGTRIGTGLRLLGVLLVRSLKFRKLRRQIREESVALEALVVLAHALVENVEGLLLL